MSPAAKQKQAPTTRVSTALNLIGAAALIEREVRARLRDEFDTTMPRFDVLAHLDMAEKDGEEGLTLSELSRRMMVTNGNLTGLVERLTEERLVKRAASSTDGRMSTISLTATGKRAFDKMASRHRVWINDLLGGLESSQVAQLDRALSRLRESATSSLGT